jgi:c-di-GMP-binding flagellar brake protein YcgR
MKKLPLEIDTDLFIEAVDHKPARAKSKILGARHGDFIIIDNPVLQFSHRLFTQFTGRILCTYLHEGNSYDFLSSVRKHLDEGLSLIDYPQEFRKTGLRAHHRIHVNIDAHMVIDQQRDPLNVTLTDLSAGGCKLVIPYLWGVAAGTGCTLSFTLPDNRNIVGLRGMIRNVRMMKLKKRTEIGMSFLEPASELEKVRQFCHFCLFFQV